jgi:hypothetical protein
VKANDVRALILESGHSVDAERAAAVEDEVGGRRATWSAFAKGVAAWVQPATARTVESYAALRMRVTHTVFFAEDPGLRSGDRLVFSGRYLVVRGARNVGEAGVLWKADCEETAL